MGKFRDLIGVIRDGREYNEAQRGVEASVVCNMGRMSAHTGQEVSFEEMLACGHEFAPEVGEMTVGSEAPVLADGDGVYPWPRPGVEGGREY